MLIMILLLEFSRSGVLTRGILKQEVLNFSKVLICTELNKQHNVKC